MQNLGQSDNTVARVLALHVAGFDPQPPMWSTKHCHSVKKKGKILTNDNQDFCSTNSQAVLSCCGFLGGPISSGRAQGAK